MRDTESETGTVMYLPAHPHEGTVVAPESDPLARVIATGTSFASAKRFNIAVAFERSDNDGPPIAESTFHHFADYNWGPSRGSPNFVCGALRADKNASSVQLMSKSVKQRDVA